MMADRTGQIRTMSAAVLGRGADRTGHLSKEMSVSASVQPVTVEYLVTVFSERAGVREFDGGAVRAVAEVGAFWDCMAEATSRGCDPAGVRYLEALCHLVHQDLDNKLMLLLRAAKEAA